MTFLILLTNQFYCQGLSTRNNSKCRCNFIQKGDHFSVILSSEKLGIT